MSKREGYMHDKFMYVSMSLSFKFLHQHKTLALSIQDRGVERNKRKSEKQITERRGEKNRKTERESSNKTLQREREKKGWRWYLRERQVLSVVEQEKERDGGIIERERESSNKPSALLYSICFYNFHLYLQLEPWSSRLLASAKGFDRFISIRQYLIIFGRGWDHESDTVKKH